MPAESRKCDVKGPITLPVNVAEILGSNVYSRNLRVKQPSQVKLVLSSYLLLVYFFCFINNSTFRRIRSLEAHVADIRQTQTTISNTLAELVQQLRQGGHNIRSPSVYPPSSFQQSPSVNSPSVSTPTVSHQHVSPPAIPGSLTSSTHGSSGSVPQSRAQRLAYQSSSVGQTSQAIAHEDVHSPMYGNFSSAGHSYDSHNQSSQGHFLPPFSTFQSHHSMGPPGAQQADASPTRFQEASHQRQSNKISGSKRQAPSSSNVTSADSSDLEDDEGGELPISGLVAPWEVLRGLADVAIERAAKVRKFRSLS